MQTASKNIASSAAAGAEVKPILAERYKTKMCKNYETSGACPYEVRCMFAHGDAELRTKEMNLRDGLVTEDAIRDFRRAATPATSPAKRSAPSLPSPSAASAKALPAKDSPKKVSVRGPASSTTTSPAKSFATILRSSPSASTSTGTTSSTTPSISPAKQNAWRTSPMSVTPTCSPAGLSLTSSPSRHSVSPIPSLASLASSPATQRDEDVPSPMRSPNAALGTPGVVRAPNPEARDAILDGAPRRWADMLDEEDDLVAFSSL